MHVLGTPPALILSQDQTLMLILSGLHRSPARAGLQRKPQLVNARPIYWLLRCSIRCICRGNRQPLVARTDNSKRFLVRGPCPGAILRFHALTLICLPLLLIRSLALADLNQSSTGFVCACTHYLVFKEPTDRSSKGRPEALITPGAQPWSRKPSATGVPDRV